MARTPSTMLPLGTSAPDFSLPDVDGRTVSLADFQQSPALVVMFICNHCPFVKHVAGELARLAKDYQPRGASFVAINSNDATAYPDDSPAKMKEEAQTRGYSFPYLYDETQKVAQAYRAACTPDFYLFDAGRKLVYRGQLDSSRPDSGIPVTGADL
ncbi:MAG TPA: thioredoxin family protein, partial [Pirellulales bacterium]|nr:thioredoxin family protein [Pirellulales bacterium]